MKTRNSGFQKALAMAGAATIILLPSVQAETKKADPVEPVDPMAWVKVSKAQEAAAKSWACQWR
jgi:hypothetical protein